MNSPKDVGEIIKKLREDNNMSQRELGSKLYVGKSAVSKWERGMGYPDISSLSLLSKTFNVSIDYLLNSKEIEEYLKKEEESKYLRSIHFRFLIIQILLIADILTIIWFNFFWFKAFYIYYHTVDLSFIVRTIFFVLIGIGIIAFEYLLFNYYYKSKNKYKIPTIILFIVIILLSLYVILL